MKQSWKSWIRAVALAMATGSAISSASAQQYNGPSPRTVTQNSEAPRKRDDAESQHRVEAILMLSNYGWQNDPDVQEALVKILRRDGTDVVRLTAAQVLTKAKTLTAKSHLALQCVLMGSDRDGGPIEHSGAVKMAVGHAMRNPTVGAGVGPIASNQNRRTVVAAWSPPDANASTWSETAQPSTPQSFASVSTPIEVRVETTETPAPTSSLREIPVPQPEPVFIPTPIRLQQPDLVYSPAPQTYIPIPMPRRQVSVQPIEPVNVSTQARAPQPLVGTLVED